MSKHSPLVLAAAMALSAAPARAGRLEALPPAPPASIDNPSTAAKVALGKQLYFDNRLSRAGNVSCNTCHNLAGGGGDGRAVAIKPDGKRSRHKTPTVWNAAFLTSFFWYGDAASLEEQAEGPLFEMALGDLPVIERRLAQVPGYRRQFSAIFGDDPGVTVKSLARALAAFERTLTTPDSPVDRFLGGDRDALSAAAERGLGTFQRLGCGGCHNGPAYGGPAGAPSYQRFPVFPGSPDEARYHLSDDPGRSASTGRPEDLHVWRVAPLRNVARTAPYFHNGAVPTLAEAVRVMARTQLGVDLAPADVADLCAFLQALSGRLPRVTLPRLPETTGESPLAAEP